MIRNVMDVQRCSTRNHHLKFDSHVKVHKKDSLTSSIMLHYNLNKSKLRQTVHDFARSYVMESIITGVLHGESSIKIGAKLALERKVSCDAHILRVKET